MILGIRFQALLLHVHLVMSTHVKPKMIEIILVQCHYVILALLAYVLNPKNSRRKLHKFIICSRYPWLYLPLLDISVSFDFLLPFNTFYILLFTIIY